MSIRVHELAKELKISTGALQKHLKDLGFVVKSHMSHLEDESADRVRDLFQQERDINKKREEERKKYLAARLKEKQLEKEQELNAKEKALKKAQERKEEIQKATPTFIEKPIDKKIPVHGIQEESKKSTLTSESNADRSVEKPSFPGAQAATKKKNTTSKPSQKGIEIPIPPPKPIEKVTSKKKTVTKLDDLDTKLKHIQAKIRNTKKGKKKKDVASMIIEEAEIKRNIKQTLSKHRKKKYKKEDRSSGQQDSKPQKIVISELTSVNELSKIMDIPATEIIIKFMKIGKKTTINQRLDKDSLEMICSEFDFDFEFEQEYGTEMLEVSSEKFKDIKEYSRPPIVTIMGHVDHGKTSILDFIRSSNVAAGESGNITQHIGAYQIEHKGSKITFLDTPGHEAFTAMRARGAHITDIAVLVVAADDGVKPQTIEAIDHAKASGVDIVVAINKIDLKTANVDKVISGLSKHNVFLENYGGDVLWATCSATTGKGIDELLESILLLAEMKDLKAKKDIPGTGVVIEAKKDSRAGTTATILLREGTLKKGDAVVCGATHGKIRLMEDEKGKRLSKLNPSDVALIYGLNEVPKEGDILNQVDSNKAAKQISLERKTTRQERERFIGRTNLDNLFTKIKQKEMADIKLIVKGDTDGSVEAFCDAIQKLSNDEVMVNIIHKGVGSIVEADVNLALASDAVIIGFHVRAENKAKKLAEDNGIQIKTYQIIYEGIAEIKKALEGMLEPDYEEIFVGSAVVKQIFKIKGVGVVAGCVIDKGKIIKEGIVRVYRNSGLIHQGKLSSLKHFANDVDEIKAGSECGLSINNYNDLKEGDILEVSKEESIPKTL